jgi:hypothetical protein
MTKNNRRNFYIRLLFLKSNMTVSNQNGRALEYVLFIEIQQFASTKNIEFETDDITNASNRRDESHYRRLTDNIKQDFILFAKTVIKWLKEEYNLENQSKIHIERKDDRTGVDGDVTDIDLKLSRSDEVTKLIRLSIKNHHNALKHPRLPRLPLFLGITDRDITESYLQNRNAVWTEFIRKCRELSGEATLFNEIKAIDRQFIDRELYLPLNNLVKNFLIRNMNNANRIQSFFEFMTSTKNPFITLKNESENLIVKNFSNIHKPTEFSIEDLKPSTFLIKFNNGWNLSFRLHTASSRMFTPTGNINKSTKYDVICPNIEAVITTTAYRKE